jgi:hypothetical protein
MDSGRASALELLRGLPTSWEVLQPSEPHPLSLVYKEWTWEHYRKLKLTFFTLSAERSRRVFIGGLSRCLGQNWGSEGPLVRPAGQALWQHHLSYIGYPSWQLKLTRVEDGFWKDRKPWLTGQGGVAGWPSVGLVGPEFCAMSSSCVILSMPISYFGYNKDTHGFWSIWCFSVI